MPNRSRTLLVLAMVIAWGPSTAPATEARTSERIRIILDTDANNELDDQHAIAYLLFNGDVFDVEGITVNRTSGGGGIDRHVEEAERVVRLCASHPQVRVYKGASGHYEEILLHIDEPQFDGSDAVNFIVERAMAEDDRPLVLIPIGKLTNIALALKKEPALAERVRIVWLGTNYPEPGEYNFENDVAALAPILESEVPFELVTVRYGQPSGTDAVKAQLADTQRIMPGKGPSLSTPVTGRHGGMFTNFGDYSVELFEKFRGNPRERPLFDMAAVAIVKNPKWAQRVTMPAPKFDKGQWVEQPDNPRKIAVWENFDKTEILQDFYDRMEDYVVVVLPTALRAPCHADEQPVKVILETDMCLDIDDVGALATLHALADMGKAEILAVCFNEVHPSGAAAIDAINTWYGRGEIPVGVYQGKLDSPDESDYLAYAADFPHDLTQETAPSALDIYLQVLARQPDKSVTIISVGFLNNLYELLKKDPEIVAQKVRELVVMGGLVNDGFNLVRHNLVGEAEYVIRNWPTRVVISQLGGDVRTGAKLSHAPAENPVRGLYYRWGGAQCKNRSSWDQIAVLYGVCGSGYCFKEVTEGKGRLRNGYEWQMKPGLRSYLEARLSTDEYAAIVETLMIKPPGESLHGVRRRPER
jgi:inosine-uridine nucleoside N-ribohydrolase